MYNTRDLSLPLRPHHLRSPLQPPRTYSLGLLLPRQLELPPVLLHITQLHLVLDRLRLQKHTRIVLLRLDRHQQRPYPLLILAGPNAPNVPRHKIVAEFSLHLHRVEIFNTGAEQQRGDVLGALVHNSPLGALRGLLDNGVIEWWHDDLDLVLDLAAFWRQQADGL
jgi:hypothetical protein